MRAKKIAPVTAASIPLILSAAGALAGEPQFQTPTTDRAQETQSLLAQAASAVRAGAPGTTGRYISNLWVFPTAEKDTVFAQYVVTTDPSFSKVAAPEQHLELLKLQGARVVEQHDLIRAASDSELHAQQSSDRRDWSASIANGHTTSTTERSVTSVGSPASPHWSAAIGNGQVSGAGTQHVQAATHASGSHAPNAHWTSKIGSARATA
jgi:hypothetical protein